MQSDAQLYVDPRQPMPICPLQNMEELVGRVMALLEYGIEEEKRLNAGKGIVKQTMWDWYNKLPTGDNELELEAEKE